MRRSFGPGMGSGGGGGMMKTVHRAIRSGIGGGASTELPYSHHSTSHNDHQPIINTPLSLVSNNLNHPVPASPPPKWASPTTSEESDWECIDDSSHVNDDYVFGTVPSKDEVHHAVSSLQEVLDEYGMMNKEKMRRTSYFQKCGHEDDQLDWREPSLELSNSMHLLPSSTSTVYDAFHLMQTEPSVQRMVISLSSDKAVWDAVMKNEVVRELQKSLSEEEKYIWEDDDHVDGCNPVKQVLHWMFVNTKDKVVEIVDKITKIVNELVQPCSSSKELEKPNRDHSTPPPHSSFQDKLRTSFLLSIMLLLIVVVTRKG